METRRSQGSAWIPVANSKVELFDELSCAFINRERQGVVHRCVSAVTLSWPATTAVNPTRQASQLSLYTNTATMLDHQ